MSGKTGPLPEHQTAKWLLDALLDATTADLRTRPSAAACPACGKDVLTRAVGGHVDLRVGWHCGRAWIRRDQDWGKSPADSEPVPA